MITRKLVMSSEKTIDQKFTDLKFILENKDKQSIKMDAHGGHSILFVYPPNREIEYLQRVRKEYSNAEIIDIAELIVDFIDKSGKDNFFEAYLDYESEPQILFKEFLNIILSKIENADKNKKLPILIRSGALSETGIENINIMDSILVHRLSVPLVIFYPATETGDKQLKFLNFKPASDYRAKVIY